MTRTQIQLPDALYAQAQRLAEREEMSLAELVRRGLATRNTRDFEGFGFARVFDPLRDAGT